MEKELYSEIEGLIIEWSNNGTKTAGYLTRQIMKLLSDNNNRNTIISDWLDQYGDKKIEYKVKKYLEEITRGRGGDIVPG
jgi:hypothetical protein